MVFHSIGFNGITSESESTWISSLKNYNLALEGYLFTGYELISL